MFRLRALAIGGFVMTILPAQAAAATIVFTDDASFQAALSGSQSILNFDSYPLGNITGNEFIGQGLSFVPRATGLPGQMEVAPPAFFSTTRYLNIGERPFVCCDGQDDALTVNVHGNWRALGFSFIDGFIPSLGESITFYGDTANVLYMRSPGAGAVTFIGIIADENIRRVFIDEAPEDSDDVGYDNFTLGNEAVGAAVPEPSTLVLVGVGAGALLRKTRRGRSSPRGAAR